MKTSKFLFILISLTFVTHFTSCKESPSEKLEDEMEIHADNLENQSDDMEDATDYVTEGFDDIEDAIENFKNALETVENAEDRKAIRERINKILDDVDLQKQTE